MAPVVAFAVGAFTKAVLPTVAKSAFLGSVVAGAAGGAAAAAFSGQPIAKGAVIGGVTGGVGHGISSALSAPAAAAPTVPGAAPITTSGIGQAVTSGTAPLSLAGTTAAATTPTAGGLGMFSTTGGAGLSGSLGTLGAGTFTGPGANTMFQPTPSSGFSSAPGQFTAGSGMVTAANLNAPTGPLSIAGVPSTYSLDSGGVNVSNTFAQPMSPLATTYGEPRNIPANITQSSPISLQGTQASTAGRTPTVADAIRQMPAEIAAKFKDPAVLAEMTLRAGAMLMGSKIAGDGMSPEERALLEAYTEELRQTRQANQALFDQRMQMAQQILGEVEYIDPDYLGRQSANAQQIAAARAKREATRGATGARREAIARQADIETGRSAGTAYTTGFTGALGARAAGLNYATQALPPSQQVTGGYGTAFDAFGNARRSRTEQQRNIGSLFERTGLFG
jgi:hypothetical protein